MRKKPPVHKPKQHIQFLLPVKPPLPEPIQFFAADIILRLSEEPRFVLSDI